MIQGITNSNFHQEPSNWLKRVFLVVAPAHDEKLCMRWTDRKPETKICALETKEGDGVCGVSRFLSFHLSHFVHHTVPSSNCVMVFP